jgi:hypothetical protein
MARSAIKLTRDQREAIYQAVRTHLVGLSDVSATTIQTVGGKGYDGLMIALVV